MIRCLSVCSGIEAWSCAVEGMDGYSVSALSEIEPFPCAVLAERYPFVPNLGDMTKINGWAMRGQIDLLVGGTPCQGFSVAGLRGGLNDPRSGLAGHYVRLAAELRVPWLLWENVPGALSTSGGADFRAFVSALDELGYGLAWAVLDAQWFGVAQRRKRLFLVGRLGDWRGPGQVLFEPRRVRRDPPARRRKGEGDAPRTEGGAGAGSQPFDVAGTIPCRGAGADRTGTQSMFGLTVLDQPNDVSSTLCASGAGTDRPSAQGSQEGFCVVSMKTDNTKANGTYISDAPVSYTLDTLAPPAVFPLDMRNALRDPSREKRTGVGFGDMDAPANTLTSESVPAVSANLYPRRLTPLECERLQGFPDGWTAVRFQGKPAKDSHRYRALGNSMAVPVMRWLAEGIREFF
jgi:DNA (cytosine-5)-methyltransferase 1